MIRFFTLALALSGSMLWAADQITVVTFISVVCPVSNEYNTRLSAIYRDYSPKDVQFLFVNSNRNESDKEVEEHAKAVGFPFPVQRDPGNTLANRFGADVTPQSFVLDIAGTVVYRGRVDDSRNEARVKQKTLRIVLDALLEGKAVPFAETKAFGCSIKRTGRSL